MKLLLDPECKYFVIDFAHENRFAVVTKSMMLCSNYQNVCCLLPCTYFMDSTTIIVITIIIQLPLGGSSYAITQKTQVCIPQ